MSAARITARARLAAERHMTESCVIDRPTGQTTDDEGRVVDTYLDPPPHVGKCKIQDGSDRATDSEVGSSTASVQSLEVHVPVGAGPFEVGDVVRVNGRVFRVTGTHNKTFQSAQRLPVEEVPA